MNSPARPVTARLLALLAATGSCMALLASGTGYLERLLPGGLPLGNLLAAVAVASAAGGAVVLSIPGTMVRHACKAALLIAVSWLPVSIGLAGNLALNFSNGNGALWAGFSAVTALGALGALVAAGAQRLVYCFRRRSSAGAA